MHKLRKISYIIKKQNPSVRSHKEVVGTGVLDGPRYINFGRELVFSADLWYKCYNRDNEKASPFGRGGGEADGEGKW